MANRTSVQLDDTDNAFVRELIESGQYPDSNAVISEALDLLRQHVLHADDDALRRLLEARRHGEFLTSGEFDQRLESMIQRFRQRHGIQG